jgi:hypothetical protein
MRKFAILFVIVLLVLMPTSAHAQSAVTFEELTIQLWPEYDQPNVLVLYDFVVSSNTPLPAQINLQLPPEAQFSAIARHESGSLIKLEYDLPKSVGNHGVVSFLVPDRSTYRVEFYMPYDRKAQTRSFLFTWPGDYAVSKLNVSLQEPVGATNVTSDPATNSEIGQDGFTYHFTTLKNVPNGQNLVFKFSYAKDNETLTGGVQSAAPLDQASGQASFMNFLPWILGGLGVALIVGGGVWYWLSGRASGGNSTSRKRHASRAEEAEGAEIYCSQCGKRAQSSDRFCRACGAKLRPAE